MTMLLQQLAVGVIVVAALGHLLWRLRRRLHAKSQAKAAGCSACDDCRGCERARQSVQGMATRGSRRTG